ncbi:hypothetical protein [Streptomyces sp. NPDC058751]|uniref:hypothetical protein n=1 Tax=Streptomyces sp. NPDC058751 TaxID=3346623 RepID=UPI0036B5CA98
MNRTVARAAALLASVLVALPGTVAAAADEDDGPLIVITDVHQHAGGDIINAGHDNVVGSGNGNGARTPGVGAPGATSAAVRITTGPRLPFAGVRLASQEGSGEYPQVVHPNYSVIVPTDGPSTAVYRSEGGAGQVRVTATVDADGGVRPNCASEGNLDCRVEFDAQGQYLVVDGR